jgi:hypothetical protein
MLVLEPLSLEPLAQLCRRPLGHGGAVQRSHDLIFTLG